MSAEILEREISFTLRVSESLNEKLISEAKKQNRSRQSQIVNLLNKHFKHLEAKEEKTK